MCKVQGHREGIALHVTVATATMRNRRLPGSAGCWGWTSPAHERPESHNVESEDYEHQDAL